jgi:arginyl-tRNA synthetase
MPGSARNGAYGDVVACPSSRATRSSASTTNDVGRQSSSSASPPRPRRGEEPPEDGYTGEYLAEIAADPGDPVDRMLDEIKRELDAFRIHFDSWVLQREITLQVEDALPQLETYEAEGTLWARTSSFGDDKDRPLKRSADGSYLYYAADVAYVRNKFERGFDRLIYVLGADHHGYVPRLEAAAAMSATSRSGSRR